MENRIAVRFEYEWHDAAGLWYRAYGNENWEFAENGLMMRRFTSINDVPIAELLGMRPQFDTTIGQQENHIG